MSDKNRILIEALGDIDLDPIFEEIAIANKKSFEIKNFKGDMVQMPQMMREYVALSFAALQNIQAIYSLLPEEEVEEDKLNAIDLARYTMRNTVGCMGNQLNEVFRCILKDPCNIEE